MRALSTPATVSEWFDPVDSVFLSNRITVNLPGTYYYVVTDTINGCQQSEGIFVYNNFIIPDISIAGYPTLTSASALDTLTCNVDTLALTTYSSTPNSTCEWMEQDTSAFYGDTLEITQGGFYYLFATESTTGCTNSTGIFILDYQNNIDAQAPENALLNCSADSVVLNGSSLSAGATFHYFTLDQFWKKKVSLDLTEDEVATIDRCLYDIPNFDNEPLPQIRHKFWPQAVGAN